MDFIKFDNSWINVDNINMISIRDYGTVIYFTGYDTPVSFKGSIDQIVNKVNSKMQQIGNSWINLDNINMISESNNKPLIWFTGYKTPVQFSGTTVDSIINKIDQGS